MCLLLAFVVDFLVVGRLFGVGFGFGFGITRDVFDDWRCCCGSGLGAGGEAATRSVGFGTSGSAGDARAG